MEMVPGVTATEAVVKVGRLGEHSARGVLPEGPLCCGTCTARPAWCTWTLRARPCSSTATRPLAAQSSLILTRRGWCPTRAARTRRPWRPRWRKVTPASDVWSLGTRARTRHPPPPAPCLGMGRPRRKCTVATQLGTDAPPRGIGLGRSGAGVEREEEEEKTGVVAPEDVDRRLGSAWDRVMAGSAGRGRSWKGRRRHLVGRVG